jgi:hypothetical protein
MKNVEGPLKTKISNFLNETVKTEENIFKTETEIIDHLLLYGILIDTYGLSESQKHVWN